MRIGLLFLSVLCLSGVITAQNWQILPTQNECSTRHENAMAAIGNRLYLLGGRGMRPVDELDLSTKTWKALQQTPMEMSHFQALSYKGEIYVLGAFTGSYPHEKPIENIYIFNPIQNAWRKGPEIPKDRLRGAAGAPVRGRGRRPSGPGGKARQGLTSRRPVPYRRPSRAWATPCVS
jgi:N-acetylneuraminic acid mutarotase